MAKGNFVAAARHYEQAQSQFYHNMNDRVMLFQARNFYEAGDIQGGQGDAAPRHARRALGPSPATEPRVHVPGVGEQGVHQTQPKDEVQVEWATRAKASTSRRAGVWSRC